MNCGCCGKEFSAKREGNRFCSPPCHTAYWNIVRKRVPLERICQWCGKPYVGFRKKYCGSKCCQGAGSRAALDRKKAERHSRGLKTHARVIKARKTCITCGSALPFKKQKYCDGCNPKIKTRGTCKICGGSLPKGHRTLCSENCRKKVHAETKYPSDVSISTKIRDRVGTRIARLLRGEKHTLNYRSGVVCFTEGELKRHLEGRFLPGMSWENYGTIWHIDHKIPVSAFNPLCDEDIRRCWSLGNLQPLFAIDNLKKGASLEHPFQPGLI